MSFVAKAGGFLLVPIAGAVLSRLLVKPTDTIANAAYKGAVAHAAVAAGSYYLGDMKFHGALSDFAVGGAWGSGVSAGLLAAAPTLKPEMKSQTVSSLPGFDKAALGMPQDNVRQIVKILTASGY